MATIKPFRALRPDPAKAERVACAPYDVVYESEAREQIAQNSETFLRVTRPEADMPPGVDPHSAEAFAKGRENLETFIRDRVMQFDPSEAVYIYQLSTDNHTQTGIVACLSIDEYEQGVIKKHENTRPDKVADRTDHMVAVGAQTGLIFLTFRGTDETRDLFSEAITAEPLYDFVDPDNIHHRVWSLADSASWEEAFRAVPSIYIADGHHRAESARLAREQLMAANPQHTGDESYNYVIAGVFPADDLKILPYNRAVKDLNSLSKDEFFTAASQDFAIEQTEEKQPDRRGRMCMYLDGEWFQLTFKHTVAFDPIERLDVSILQNYILTPILGIGDPRVDTRITFVGGKRGTEELEKLVDEGSATVAFSMFATTMDDLLAVSDADEIMPPKSTWFEPKLKDGLLVHMINNG